MQNAEVRMQNGERRKMKSIGNDLIGPLLELAVECPRCRERLLQLAEEWSWFFIELAAVTDRLRSEERRAEEHVYHRGCAPIPEARGEGPKESEHE
jgi:hypothetical protein